MARSHFKVKTVFFRIMNLPFFHASCRFSELCRLSGKNGRPLISEIGIIWKLWKWDIPCTPRSQQASLYGSHMGCIWASPSGLAHIGPILVPYMLAPTWDPYWSHIAVPFTKIQYLMLFNPSFLKRELPLNYKSYLNH